MDSATDATNPRVAFIEAATWHGTLERAEAILAAHPELAGSDIHTAAILGDDAGVRRFLTLDATNATRTSSPYGGDALVYLCLSKYLRLDLLRSDAFLRAATSLLDAGANPNSGFWTTGDFPEFETALYGAAGVAHHAAMARLLLEHGADPNDGEAVYHSPETYDNAAMKLLVETGRVAAENLALMLVRKHDWHDYEGVKYLLEHGADPNHNRERGFCPIHHAVARDNDTKIFMLLLDHGADPTLLRNDRSTMAMAAHRGRGDLLALFRERGIPIELHGVDRLIAACATNDSEAIRTIAAREPELVRELLADGAALLAEFAGNGNTKGVTHLLDLGVSVQALYRGDGYWDIANGSTALHVAAWRARHETVKLLLRRRAPVDLPDGKARTPLALAVRACVDSYWTGWRSPDSVRTLLEAGASVKGVLYPSGYKEVDDILRQYGAGA
ncbi:MAG: ankyrin repeat domain-containing protein [Ignavibacteriales bacterium]|nr:ankyrin repeat domain-containing protein [Ignavibacteriales bacterium]